MGIASVVPFYFEVDMNKIRKTELLAPAGSYEAFEAALGAGETPSMQAVRPSEQGRMQRILQRKN